MADGIGCCGGGHVFFSDGNGKNEMPGLCFGGWPMFLPLLLSPAVPNPSPPPGSIRWGRSQIDLRRWRAPPPPPPGSGRGDNKDSKEGWQPTALKMCHFGMGKCARVEEDLSQSQCHPPPQKSAKIIAMQQTAAGGEQQGFRQCPKVGFRTTYLVVSSCSWIGGFGWH